MTIDMSVLQDALSNFSMFLHKIEPGFVRQLPLPLRLAVLYTVARAAWVLCQVALGIVGGLVVQPILLSLQSAARWSGSGRIAALARVYVRIELFSWVVGIPPLGVSQDEPSLGKASGYSPGSWEGAFAKPQAVGSVRYLLGYVLHLPLFVALGSVSLIPLAIRFFAPYRIVNILAWIAVIAYLGLLPGAAHLLTEIEPPNITLTTVVAAGSILVLIYAAVGSDIRGRAELNKNASFECRKILHECRRTMKEAADILAFLRMASVEALRYYPSASSLQTLTGRTDRPCVARFRPCSSKRQAGRLAELVVERIAGSRSRVSQAFSKSANPATCQT